MSNLGVQEGEQDDGDGEEIKKYIPCIKVVKFFFTNFLPEWNKANLRELFGEVGEIQEDYLARKMSKEGKRLGFIRFFRVGNLHVPENW